MNKKQSFILGLIIVLIVVGAALYNHYRPGKNNNITEQGTASQLEAMKSKVEKFINENLVPPGVKATVKNISEENGLYKLTINVNNQEITSYASKDGKNFFPEAISMETKTQNQNEPANQAPNQPITKSAVPEVDLFVMSYCPYGLQAEKGILPVVDLLGSKIKFNLKFVDYAMHGEKEIDENLRQYCIDKIAPAKLSAYLKCFTEQGNADACLKNVQIDAPALNACTIAADTQFQIKAKFNDKTTWANSQYPPFDIYKADNEKYKVGGSPTLVINGVTVSPARDSQSLLTTICSAFSDQPSECSQKLSSQTPSPGFGSTAGASSGSSDASCGN